MNKSEVYLLFGQPPPHFHIPGNFHIPVTGGDWLSLGPSPLLEQMRAEHLHEQYKEDITKKGATIPKT